jgi:hypothetical protein
MTRKLYGLDSPDTEEFGRECLVARRMVERGVRFIELLTPYRFGLDRWDQHGNLEQGITSMPGRGSAIAALLKDLRRVDCLTRRLLSGVANSATPRPTLMAPHQVDRSRPQSVQLAVDG